MGDCHYFLKIPSLILLHLKKHLNFSKENSKFIVKLKINTFRIKMEKIIDLLDDMSIKSDKIPPNEIKADITQSQKNIHNCTI
ncbi:hypothetical protein BpHYR1_005262 [Brachionus plicatilis]|uniref:Uncharacterized protein n=1 Tax=Brachionus plicatilis TaxID=10195 RepID=A0A3M7PWL3_BRAPC|nr:hypothetical protein BpHYR1_005262 [Brachionus plicatilis]